MGERGRAIGVDMVPEMLKRAKEAARRVGMLGVTSFRLGENEHPKPNPSPNPDGWMRTSTLTRTLTPTLTLTTDH